MYLKALDQNQEEREPHSYVIKPEERKKMMRTDRQAPSASMPCRVMGARSHNFRLFYDNPQQDIKTVSPLVNHERSEYQRRRDPATTRTLNF
jgi:hypothetical protein